MVVEIQTFRLVVGVDESEFLAADERVQHELSANAPGFVRRTTARGDSGEWLVLTLWDSPHDPQSTALDAFIDSASLEVRKYTTLD